MPEVFNEQTAEAIDFVFRRALPAQCKAGKHPTAFIPRKTETSLSVYHAGMRSPRSLLQDYLNGQLVKRSSSVVEEIERANNMLKQYGATVEEIVANGWGVFRIGLSVFLELGFTADAPIPVDQPNAGHINIFGEREDFQLHAMTLANRAVLLTAEQCLG